MTKYKELKESIHLEGSHPRQQHPGGLHCGLILSQIANDWSCNYLYDVYNYQRTKEEIAIGKEDTTLLERAIDLMAAATWPRGNLGGATSPSSGSPSMLASADTSPSTLVFSFLLLSKKNYIRGRTHVQKKSCE